MLTESVRTGNQSQGNQNIDGPGIKETLEHTQILVISTI